jgi:Mg-chelatase subunit ChlD
MRGLTFKLGTAVVTFLIGVGIATAWFYLSRAGEIQPVNISSTSKGPALELVFVLDTTSSMTGLIDGAKQRIWQIVNEVMTTPSHPAVKVGLVAYRDRGDEYVTKTLPLTNDLDLVYSTLMDYRAEGGGDAPENVRGALAQGVRSAGWSNGSENVAQIIFLVGDAPPHNDYPEEPDTNTTATEAAQMGMIVNTIQCGEMQGTREAWQSIASMGEGQYFVIAQDGGVQAVKTPFDDQLGDLARALGETYVAYGGGAGAAGVEYRERAQAAATRLEAKVYDSAPAEAKAARAMNKVVNSYAYIGDVLQDIENGSVTVETLKVEDLPAELQQLSLEERKAEIERRLAKRRELRAQIVELARKRDEYIARERVKAGGANGSFDAAVSAALKEQLARKGIK